MAERRRLNLVLDTRLPSHLQTWQILQRIPAGKRSQEVCRIICSQEDKKNREILLKEIRQIIREELAEVTVSSTIIDIKKINEAAEPQSVSSDVLGFLLSLQGEGDST